MTATEVSFNDASAPLFITANS